MGMRRRLIGVRVLGGHILDHFRAAGDRRSKSRSDRPVTSWQRANARYKRTPTTDCAVDRVDAQPSNSNRCKIGRPVISYLESHPDP
jgi:hypothetical protein